MDVFLLSRLAMWGQSSAFCLCWLAQCFLSPLSWRVRGLTTSGQREIKMERRGQQLWRLCCNSAMNTRNGNTLDIIQHLSISPCHLLQNWDSSNCCECLQKSVCWQNCDKFPQSVINGRIKKQFNHPITPSETIWALIGWILWSYSQIGWF